MSTLLRLCVAHLVGNAALLALGYYWLGVGESDAARLAWSAALLLMTVCGTAWLHGSALAYFHDPEAGGLGAIARRPLSRWLPLAVLVVIAAAIYFAAEYWNPASASRVNRTASWLTLTFQTPVRPEAVERALGWTWLVVRWMLIPVLLLPVGAGVAARGWAGFAELGVRLKSWSYWVMVPVLLVVAVGAPFRLMAWKPALSSFGMELASFAARFGAAYLLFVAGCLLLALVTSRGRPVASQETTTVSP